jgi:alanine racemase
MTGLMSHLACADHPDPEPTLVQLRAFEAILGAAQSRGLRPRHCHVANSAAAIAFTSSRLDAVRPGIALYGVSPFEVRNESTEAVSADLRPVMRVRTEVVALRTLADGDRVGYGHTWRAEGERRVATIPMGYADGLSRGLSNRGHVVIRGRRAPIVGIVSMDLTTIDVTEIPGVSIGDEVVILGAQEGPLGSAQVTSEEIAKLLGTIPWEVVTSISRRVPRFYREP